MVAVPAILRMALRATGHILVDLEELAVGGRDHRTLVRLLIGLHGRGSVVQARNAGILRSLSHLQALRHFRGANGVGCCGQAQMEPEGGRD